MRTNDPTARDRTYMGGIKGTLLDAAKMSNVPPSVADLVLDAHDRMAQVEGLLRVLVRQIESADYRHPESGSPLRNNVHFIKAKEAVSSP